MDPTISSFKRRAVHIADLFDDYVMSLSLKACTFRAGLWSEQQNQPLDQLTISAMHTSLSVSLQRAKLDNF